MLPAHHTSTASFSPWDWRLLALAPVGRGFERERPKPGVPQEVGIGLSNTHARLRHLQGDAHRLELLPAEGGGAEQHS